MAAETPARAARSSPASARGIGAATAPARSPPTGWPVLVNYRSDADSADGARRSGRGRGRARARPPGRRRRPRSRSTSSSPAPRRSSGRPRARQQRRRARRRARAADRGRRLETRSSTPTSRPPSTPPAARCGRCCALASGGSSTSPRSSGTRANAGQANYAASKAGLIGMTKTVAVEVARRGITVNAVAPGLVETQLTEGIGNGLADGIPVAAAGHAGGGCRLHPLPRLRARPPT